MASMGMRVVTVPCDDDRARTGYAYTRGLAELGHAEFVVVGLGEDHARRVLTALAEQVRRGAIFADGDQLVCAAITPATLRVVEVDAGEIPAARVLQVMYADFRGAFPWDASYRYPAWLQRIPEASAASAA